jgi:hypothetical protein
MENGSGLLTPFILRYIPSELGIIAVIILLTLAEAAAQTHNPLVFTSGTTIVIHKSPSEIVVGADSLRMRRSGTLAVPLSECKIRRVGNDFFAIAGNIREQVKGFDAVRIATEAVKSSGKAVGKVKAFEQKILAPLTEVLSTARSNTEYFDKLFRDRIVLAVAFFGIEQRTLYLYVRTYIATIYNSNDVKVEFENRTDCLTDCNQTFALGENAAIKEFTNKNPKYRAASSVEKVRKLVQLEIEQRPEYVGPPIDIVRLDTNGANWVQVKPECK